MPTFNQLSRKKTERKPRWYKNKKIALQACPQKRATCLKVYTITPRKPNSALRKISRVVLSNFRRVQAYIPGIGHNLQKHSTVLIRGGRVKDIPGMKYTMIRGKKDLRRLEERRNARSKFGVKKTFKWFDHRYKKYKYW